MSVDDWIKIIGGALGGAGTGMGAMLLARKQLSNDEVDIAKNRAEVDFLQTILNERDTLRDEIASLRDKHIECLRNAERLIASAESDNEVIHRLERDAQRLLAFAPDSVRRMLETNFGGLDDGQEK